MTFKTFAISPPRSPVIFSVPHAGRMYPPELASLAHIDETALKSMEDRFADTLVQGVIEAGYPTIIAETARAWIDLNRGEREYDPALITGAASPPMPSVKVRGGLGIIPKRIANHGNIWRSTIDGQDFEARLAVHHRPYHAALADTIEAALGAFGIVFLLDIHSMPPLSHHGNHGAPKIIVGDLFGRSASPRYADAVSECLSANGVKVATNVPYAGGHILERHSNPGRGIHALQIEIDRGLYLDDEFDRPGEGLETIQRMVAHLAQMLDQEARKINTVLAAE